MFFMSFPGSWWPRSENLWSISSRITFPLHSVFLLGTRNSHLCLSETGFHLFVFQWYFWKYCLWNILYSKCLIDHKVSVILFIVGKCSFLFERCLFVKGPCSCFKYSILSYWELEVKFQVLCTFFFHLDSSRFSIPTFSLCLFLFYIRDFKFLIFPGQDFLKYAILK
jgi:hypothetical protein